MLSVNDGRHSRSKSPSGRDRDRSRSRSRDTRDIGRDRSPVSAAATARSERRSSRYADEPRYEERKPSKKYDDDYADGDDRRVRDDRTRDTGSSSSRKTATTSGRRYAEDGYDAEPADRRHRSSRSSKTHRRDVSASDNDGGDRRRDRAQVTTATTSSNSKPVYVYAAPPTSASARSYQDTDARHMSYGGGDPRYAAPSTEYRQAAAPGKQRPASSSGPAAYAEPEKFRYAQVDHAAYSYENGRSRDAGYAEEREQRRPEKQYHDDRYKQAKVYTDDKYVSRSSRDKDDVDNGNYEVRRYKVHNNDATPSSRTRDRRYSDDKDRHGASVDTVTRRLGSVTVTGAAAGAVAGAGLLGAAQAGAARGQGPAPASPLLESYKGTYQSISPMPGALAIQHKDDSDVSDFGMASDSDDDDDDDDDPNADLKRKIRELERERERHAGVGRGAEARRPSQSKADPPDVVYEIRAPRGVRDDDGDGRATTAAAAAAAAAAADRTVAAAPERKKRVMFYDAESDARTIYAALQGTSRAADVRPLIDILPGLSDDDIMALRSEYKKIARVNGQGINLAKHVKARVGGGNLGKVCYATTLGRWESEANWANVWYQGGSTRRELLIEALMGRSNSDIREIKNSFRDKRYADDLEQCLRAELRADKFRTAVLLALAERRAPESAPVSRALVQDDVAVLHAALLNPAGGESAMIETIVVRSDRHLRALLQAFDETYDGMNLALCIIDKSRNLVGETLVHILNGALNRPMRDALLLHQAIAESAPRDGSSSRGGDRADLLISRLVRLHWEPKHLEKVKAEFRARYGLSVEAAIMKDVYANMKTDDARNWVEFCVALVRSSA